jgi:DNA-binding beta-propeller fold protein YncE
MKAMGDHRFSIVATAVVMLTLGAIASGGAHAADKEDVLYVGDAGDNTIKRFDARTGAFLGTLVKDPAKATPGVDLMGPRGIVFDLGNLLVVNQNVNTPFDGAIQLYSAETGALLKQIVPAQLNGKDNPNAPGTPRGMVRRNNHIFVADLGDFLAPRVLEYSASGVLRATLTPPPEPFDFHPRGVVIGPDGELYVSNFPDLATGLGGQILQFDPASGKFLKVFVTNDGSLTRDCTDKLNRPEGLVFGPDGNIYITSFRADAKDTDKILIFAGPKGTHPGACIGQIDLDQVGQGRSFAQALLFGPKGDLFVPITDSAPFNVSPAGQDAGAVRRYNVGDKKFNIHQSFTYFVQPNAKHGALIEPWYLTFGKTDPGTLAYDDDDQDE